MFAYWKKAIGAVFVTVALAVVSYLSDDHMDPKEWMLTVGIFAGAVGVAVVPNLPKGSGIAEWSKAITMFLTAGSAVAAVSIVGGFTTAEVLEVAIAGLFALGVVVVPTNVGDYRATAPPLGVMR